MRLPKQVIEDIRRRRFRINLDTSNVPKDVQEFIDDSMKFKEDSARLVTDLYTTKPHFILELIQNAEDNEYDQNVEPGVKFIIQKDHQLVLLILQNNEKGFTEENVWALCGIGETTKQNRNLGYLGEKGIGFKSIFMVTNKPRVYSNGFQFEFKYDEKKPISIIIPHWVNYIPSFVEPSETNIILQLKDEVKSELNKFTKIDPCLLLFLRKLITIIIQDKTQNKPERKIERYDSEGKVKITHPDGEDYWKVIKAPESLKVPENIKEEKRKDVTETEIILAFPLKSNGSANTSTEQKLFVYLPIRSYGFKFIIQADFLVPPPREDIHKDKPWNMWLRNNIAPMFLQAVNEFKQDEALKKTFYNYIPLVSDVTDPFFLPVVEQIHTHLQKTECILTESGNWRKPADVFLTEDTKIIKLISNDDLRLFFNKEYISPRLKAKREILTALGVETLGFAHLVKCLEKTEWLEKQSDEWFFRLYAYLNSLKLTEMQILELRKLKIMRLENNTLTSTLDGPVFFPLHGQSDYGFEAELRLLKRNILTGKRKETKEAIVAFLDKKIGVKHASPYEIIDTHILPIYQSSDKSSNWQSRGRKTLLGYIRYIKENLPDYEKGNDKKLNANKESWETRNDPLARLKTSLYFHVAKTVNGTNYYDHCRNIYLPKVYGNKNDLESLFGGIENVSFVHREYIDDIIKKNQQLTAKHKGSKTALKQLRRKKEADIREWKEFFIKLGVNDGLKVEGTNGSYLSVEEKKYLRKSEATYSSLYNASYDYTSEDITDYTLQFIDPILNTISKPKISSLIRLFEKQWEFLSKYKQLTYEWRYYRRYSVSADSTWFHLLKITPWLPTTKGTVAKPSEVFLDKAEIRELLGDNVSYLAVDVKNEEFITALEINSEANVEGVLENLRGFVEQKCSDRTIFAKLYDFLDKHYGNNENIIKTAFRENRIIYVPDTSQSYFMSREVLWKDVSEIFGETRGYLEKHYEGLKSFFVDKLGVSEKPTPKNYADVLIDLSQKEKVNSKDENIILKVYKELNSHLDPENSEYSISEEDWWPDFIREAIFWTNKEEFWTNDNDVFVNDNKELYQLFKDNPQIAFLKLPQNYHPKIQHFLETAGIPCASRIMKAELAIEETAKSELSLTEQIQNFAPYILRYLYHLEYDTYERLKKEGRLIQLKNLPCYSVENLQVKYILNRQSASAQRNATLYRGNLYIQNDSSEDMDHLAVELSKLFGEPRGLDDFLISLFYKKTEGKIENLLGAKGIPQLPDEEQQWFGIVEPIPIEEVISEEEKTVTEAETKPISPEIAPPPTEFEAESRPESQAPETTLELRLTEKHEWRPECTPEEAEVQVEEYHAPKTKERKTRVAGGDSDKPRLISSKEEDEVQHTLSADARKAIGRWGEEYAIKCLKDRFSGQYPQGKVEETEDGFNITSNSQIIVQVHWLNKKGEKGVGHDIEVAEVGSEQYIEVKSTITDAKEWFTVSKEQWKFIREEGDKFHIYRICNAGTEKQAKLVDIPNPSKLWQEGSLVAYPIQIQI